MAAIMADALVRELTLSRGDGAPSAEESALAVAQMRAAVGDRDLLARFTQATLRENGFSYRDQEFHTGLAASTVYNMALGKDAGLRAVQQFAAFAAYRAGREETRIFWRELLERLRTEDAAPLARTGRRGETAGDPPSPETIALGYAKLHRPESRKALADLLNALTAAEAGQSAAAAFDTLA